MQVSNYHVLPLDGLLVCPPPTPPLLKHDTEGFVAHHRLNRSDADGHHPSDADGHRLSAARTQDEGHFARTRGGGAYVFTTTRLTHHPSIPFEQYDSTKTRFCIYPPPPSLECEMDGALTPPPISSSVNRNYLPFRRVEMAVDLTTNTTSGNDLPRHRITSESFS